VASRSAAAARALAELAIGLKGGDAVLWFHTHFLVFAEQEAVRIAELLRSLLETRLERFAIGVERGRGRRVRVCPLFTHRVFGRGRRLRGRGLILLLAA
jgi:hypothetical protein